MRKHRVVRIDDEKSRDHGKAFVVVEMDAMRAEKWAIRAMLAMGRAGVEIPDDALMAGSAGLIGVGLAGLIRLPFADAEPLLDEITGCIFVAVAGGQADPLTGRPDCRPLQMPDAFNDGDIQEVATLLRLREEVAELHLGFSIRAVLSTWAESRLSSLQQNSQTSQEPAARSSRAKKQA